MCMYSLIYVFNNHHMCTEKRVIKMSEKKAKRVNTVSQNCIENDDFELWLEFAINFLLFQRLYRYYKENWL